jgi:hypothetical protein
LNYPLGLRLVLNSPPAFGIAAGTKPQEGVHDSGEDGVKHPWLFKPLQRWLFAPPGSGLPDVFDGNGVGGLNDDTDQLHYRGGLLAAVEVECLVVFDECTSDSVLKFLAETSTAFFRGRF